MVDMICGRDGACEERVVTVAHRLPPSSIVVIDQRLDQPPKVLVSM
jgi:hypothetical protein